MTPNYTLGKAPAGNYTLSGCPEVTKTTHQDLSEQFHERAINFYHRQPMPSLSYVWEGMHREILSPMIDALESKDIPALRVVLEQLYESGITRGIDSPSSDISHELFRELFVALANALSLLPVINLEQEPGRTVEFGTLLQMVNSRTPLNWPGRLGRISGWLQHNLFVPVKMLESSLVVATAGRFCTPSKVLEIGAGCGFVGYAFLQNYHPCVYHTVDLPVVSVLQGCMLASALGEEAVVFDGEERSVGLVFIHGGNLPDTHFDLVVNVNSLPEIPMDTGLKYLRYASERSDWFLSINQEARANQQVWISKLAESVDWQLLNRSPWWAREHYVQEIYRCSPNAAPAS